MIRKWLLVSLGCLLVAPAVNAGTCRGGPCRYLQFGKDKEGCLEVRNSGREDIEVTVYVASGGSIRVQVAAGDTEKVYKAGRICIPVADYVRSDAQVSGGIFSPSR